jgi:hypothetical protein
VLREEQTADLRPLLGADHHSPRGRERIDPAAPAPANDANTMS